MAAAMMMNVPIKSMLRIFSFQVALTGAAAAGEVKQKNMMAAEIPPNGRLI